MANVDQSAWSVCYIEPNYVVAKGSTCTPATAYDSIEANEIVATDSDFPTTFLAIVFAQLTGDTTATSITVVQDSRSSIISLNEEGTIIW